MKWRQHYRGHPGTKQETCQNYRKVGFGGTLAVQEYFKYGEVQKKSGFRQLTPTGVKKVTAGNCHTPTRRSKR